MANENGEVVQQLQFQIQDTQPLTDGVYQRVPPTGCAAHVPQQIFNVIDSSDVHVGDVYNLTINRIVPIEYRSENNRSADTGSVSGEENDFVYGECVNSTNKLHRRTGVLERICFPENITICRRRGIVWGFAMVILLLIFSLVTTLAITLRDDEEDDHIGIIDPRRLLPIDCGSTGNGTNDPVLDEYPWIAVVEYDIATKKKLFTCSGSLINSRYVLTSGGCADLPAQSVRHVRLGACIQKENCSDTQGYFGVEERILHPEWSRPLRINDIALLRLDREVQFSREIQPTCLPKDAVEIKSLEDEVLISAGVSFTPLGISSVLVQEPVSVHGFETCSKYKKSQFTIDETVQVCATPVHFSAKLCCCITGGALMKRSSDRSYLTGIMMQRSSICFDSDIPTEFTRVDAYIPWILSQLRP